MIVFKNQADSVDIDIFTSIGEGFFDEGITVEWVRGKLKRAGSLPVRLNIASLGGNVDHALAIHDILKMHQSPVTARILGATASAATIIAMGADTIEMSENALFLVHPVWTVVMGTAEDLRKDANDLDKFDSRVVNIYRIKTGKQDEEIIALMKEDKWITAAEAEAFGFVDSVFTPAKAAAMAIPVEEINNSGIFPKIQANMDQKTFFQELSDGFKAFFASSKPEPPVAVVVETPEVVETPVNEAEIALQNRVADLEASLEAERQARATADAEVERLKVTTSAEDHEDVAVNGKGTPLSEADQWTLDLVNLVKTKHNIK